MRVLIVEDEPYMAEAIRDGLRLEAIAADIAGDGDSALELLSVNAYDIAVLDRDIPGPSGDEIARRIVASGSGMPILMLTAADRLDDKASGFELGADDYLTKPFELQELVLRLRALDRRRAHNRPPVREIAGLRLDPFRREVYRDGRYVALTRKQFAVLEVLVAAEGGVVSAEELLNRAWDRERRPVHQRRAHHRLGTAQTPRRTLDHRHRGRRRLPHRLRRHRRRRRPWIEPWDDVRLKLTLRYAGFLMLAGVVLLGDVGCSVPASTCPTGIPHRPTSPRPQQCVAECARSPPSHATPTVSTRAHPVRDRAGDHDRGLDRARLAGRGPGPAPAADDDGDHAADLRAQPERAPRAPGPRDELKDLADTIDGLLARLEAHFAEQQRFAANASHELRTPLAITQTLLDVARNDPNRDNGELVDRLQAVNTRAIDLTEALLLLSRADQRSFTREHVDLSLIAEEATETLLPLAEKRGVTIETSGDMTPTIGSHALLLQMTTNLVHNAIVHNLPDTAPCGSRPAFDPEGVVLTVENTGEQLTPQLVSTLTEPFQRGTERVRTDHAGVGLGLAIVKSITQAHDGTLTLTPRAAGGLCVTVQLPAAPPHIGR